MFVLLSGEKTGSLDIAIQERNGGARGGGAIRIHQIPI